MSKLMVYLAGISGTVEWPSPIRTTIEGLLKKVVRASNDFSAAEVRWTRDAPALNTYDLLAYFVARRSSSVIRRGLSSSVTLGDTGTTAIGGTTVASEVYLAGHQDDPQGLGKLAFHELMHNICLMMNGLHDVAGVSLGAEEINADTELNQHDINLLVKHLKKKRVQWKGGFDYKQ